MSEIQRIDFLAMHGKSLINNGYNIVPIPPRSKAPGYPNWQKTKASINQLSEWLQDGYADHGIGIITKNTPAIDLDILDKDVLKKIVEWCEMNFGTTPLRVGKEPKSLLLFRTDEPFRKMKTGKYEDEWGDEHEIEVLCDGQQFVAYGIHKDTGKPYQWTLGTDPLNTPVASLTTLTPDDVRQLMTYFEQLAKQAGWKKVGSGLSGGARLAEQIDDNDPFADVETTVDLPEHEIRDRLMSVPGADDYDLWMRVGMALYHQFDGNEVGLKMWHEWSETADNYEKDALSQHWKSFNITGKGKAPTTARLILKLAKEASASQIIELISELKDAFYKAKDSLEWKDACKQVRRAEIDAISRSEIAEIARRKFGDITGTKLPITEVRKAIAYELYSNDTAPYWCRDWVFDASDDKFFHTVMKVKMSIQGFNAVYSRSALTKKDIAEGRSTPQTQPSELALNYYKIKEVFGVMYSPGEEKIFNRSGLHLANSYPEYQIPKLPRDDLSPKELKAIQRVKEHISHLLENKTEQHLFMNWVAWIIQNPGKLLKWAMVLQGVEGDGKSFWGLLLRAVMGVSNVKMLNASVLESNFSGWAVGQCVLVIEEPRLQGHNRYDVINRIKPLITNPIIPIHAKGKEACDVENTTNYFLPTNFRDALPLNDNDRRYCVLFSKWQNRKELLEFREENPNYYTNLYNAIETCAPAIRRWLIEHEIDHDFPSNSDAPITDAHRYMTKAAKPEVIQVVQEIIDEAQHPDITEHLLNATALPDVLIGRDTDIPNAKTMSRTLKTQATFSSVGSGLRENYVDFGRKHRKCLSATTDTLSTQSVVT